MTLDLFPQSIVKPLIVGEANPYGGDPEFALWPAPRGASGDRLCRIVMGLDSDTYVESFDRMNLFPTEWRGMKEARVRAGEIIRARRAVERIVLILLGTKVRDAFELRVNAPASKRAVNVVAVVLPHPSGLNRAWRVPSMVNRCRDVLKREIPGVPFGEVAS